MRINQRSSKTIKLILLIGLVSISCKKNDSLVGNEEAQNPPNILLIIADDMGLDATPGYEIGSIKPTMPNLQNLIDSGIRFNNVWSYPTCTPTRSSILTGKYGFRTKVLNVGDVLSTQEQSIQKYIELNSPTSYSNSVIGKWHLSSDENHPSEMGIDYFAGLLSGTVQSYTNWNFTKNGNTVTSDEYVTTKFTDLAIDWVSEQNDEPWFLWLAYNAPHTPIHLPPSSLHSQGDLSPDQTSIDENPLPYYMAMIEAMDSEMGRLINSLSQEEKENTIIIFIGDNGTSRDVAQDYNTSRVKGTVYQGGINVPMIISGNSVSRINQSENALISTVDLFATIAELTGSNLPEINDSKSFKDLFTNVEADSREYVYSEIGLDSGNSDYTIRNSTHKYIRFEDGSEALFNLSANSFERPNLLSENQLPLSSTDSLVKIDLINAFQNIQN